MNNKILVILILIVSGACAEKKGTQLEEALTDLKEKNESANSIRYDEIVVIPGSGCGGCISDAEKYIFENKEGFKTTLVVYTYITDFKGFKMQREKFLEAMPNLLLDQENILINSGFSYTKPQVFLVNESGQVELDQEFSHKYLE